MNIPYLVKITSDFAGILELLTCKYPDPNSLHLNFRCTHEAFWPCNQARDNEAAMEEERRLFYVAITRPKSHLILTVQSDNSGLLGIPSRFLEEAKFLSKEKIGVT